MLFSNKEIFRFPFLYRVGFRIVLVMFLGLSMLNPFVLMAQDPNKAQDSTKKIQLDEQQWKAVEGIFQSPRNAEMYVQFRAGGGVLLAKLLWNNREIKLSPESALTFANNGTGEEENVRIRFVPDEKGVINAVAVGNDNQNWKRVNDYHPIVKVEMKHTPDQLKAYEGLYQFEQDKERFIQFTEKENRLILRQHWDGNEIPFVPMTELDFFSKEATLFSLSFVKENDGTISKAIAFKTDKWDKVKRIIPTAEQLKAYEGKYQFKEDPDNNIQIISKGNKLVVKQLWDGKEILLEPLTDTYFCNSDPFFPLQFIKDNDGKITQALAMGNRFMKLN